jgi:hypothetical protein
MHELILTVRVLMGLQECNHVLSTHFSFSLFLALFLHGFKLGRAITAANVIYYPERRAGKQLNYAVGYGRSMLELHNHKMNYGPSIIYIHLYILLPFMYFLLISFKMGNVIKKREYMKSHTHLLNRQ